MVTSTARTRADALAAFAALTPRLPERYLLVGAQASYLYQHWLLPIRKMIELRIPPPDLARWQSIFPPEWTVLTEIPFSAQVRAATRLARLETTLDDTLYQRRRSIDGLNVIAPEDLAMELLARAATQISLAELAALLVQQRAELDWNYLGARARSFGLAKRLREIMTAINREAGQPLLPTQKISSRATPAHAPTTHPAQLLTHLPPELHPTRYPPIAPATITNLLRGARASGKLSNGRRAAGS